MVKRSFQQRRFRRFLDGGHQGVILDGLGDLHLPGSMFPGFAHPGTGSVRRGSRKIMRVLRRPDHGPFDRAAYGGGDKKRQKRC